MEAASPAAEGDASQPLRGFCYECEREVVPVPTEDEGFQCPLCQEACVECPYESFERWEGAWQLRLANGRVSQMTVDEHGCVDFGPSGPGPVAVRRVGRLRWAPTEHEGFLMRLEGHPSGGHLHLGPAPDGGEDGGAEASDRLRVRHEAGEVVLDGVAERAEDASLVGLLDSILGRAAEPAGPGAAAQPRLRNLHRFLDQGLEQLAAQLAGPGSAPGPEREQMVQQLRQLTAPFLDALARPEGGPGGPGGRNAPGASQFDFTQFLNQSFFDLDPNVFGQHMQEQRHSGAAPAAAAAWLQTRSIDGVEDLESDWQCPICFDGEPRDLVAVCRDERGRTLHAFHRPCVEAWLVRRDECPSCRRSPVVEAPPPGDPGSAPGRARGAGPASTLF